MKTKPLTTESLKNERLSFTADEVRVLLGSHKKPIGRTTLWRLEKEGRIRPVPGLVRNKIYAVEELRRFISGAPLTVAVGGAN